MQRAILRACAPLAIFLLVIKPAFCGSWYVPIEEQVPGGFDHIQLLMCRPYQFDSPAMSAFSGPSPVGEQWSQTVISVNQLFAAADGPNPGDQAIHFSIWIFGDPQVDRPAFHLQAYKGPNLVDNADLICFGPGELDWMVAPGTWKRIKPIPPWPPGDANCDGQIDGADYTIWADHYKQAGGWGQADFNADNFVDGADYTIWADHYDAPNGTGGGVSGAATLSVTGPGPAAAGAAEVPEPGLGIVLVLALRMVATGRRRKR